MFAVLPAHAASVHVEAATRAYLDSLQGVARAKSDAYFEGGYWLLLWGTLVWVAAAWVLLRSGWAVQFRRWAQRVTRRRWIEPAIVAPIFFVASSALVLPWRVYAGYVREKRYDLMTQSFGSWARDELVSVLVGAVGVAIVACVLFALIRRAPTWWWCWATGAIGVLLALFVMVSPVLISPLFNTYRPMPASALRDEILAMAAAHEIPARDVYVFDQSKQHKRISANVNGLGSTMRISLNDNLLARCSPEEVKAVMGHEMGHYVLGHVWKNVLSFSVLFGVGFFAIAKTIPPIIARRGRRWGVDRIDDPASLPLVTIVLAIFLLLARPVANSIIRSHESEADAFGLDAAREPDGMAMIAMKLSEYRKIEPSPLEEIVFFDHPSGATRVRMAMAWKAAHAP